MKKIFALVFVTVLLFVNAVSVFALGSGVSSFSINPIDADQKHKYIKINITAPKKQSNSKLLVGFYVDGTLTKLTPFDISSQTSFENQQIQTSVLVKTPSGNYYKDLTPDEIKIFTWDKTSLKPKTLCYNALTHDVITKANAEVVESLSIIPEATEFIRNEFLVWEEDVEDGIAETWDENLFIIMDKLDECSIKATEDAETHLMTSLYAQVQYYDDLSQIRVYANKLSKQEQKTMDKLLSGGLDPIEFPTKYYDALNNAMKFLDFTLTEL